MSLTFPSVVIQTNLTFTAKRWGQFSTISFTNGATAGSEVVSVDSSLNITVQIQSGTTTMLQVKTAIDATAGSATGLAAGDLVTVTVTSGHNSDAVVTVKNALLAGGTALRSASLTIGHLVYTAVTGGTGGNSIRVKYTSGGSLSVSVSSNDITVQLKNDGSSTNALIKAAVAASGSAAALVTTASDGLALSFVPTTAMASSFLSLSGGTAAVAPSHVLQDLTFSSDKTGTTDNGKTITYTTGATAGSEVVTMSSGNASIQIENGVSTATQIKAACDASASFNGVAASLIQQGVTYTAKLVSTAGNAYSVRIIDSGSGHLSYVEPLGVIVIDLGGDTVAASDIVTLIGTTTPSAFVNVAGTTGAASVHAVAPLTGGVDGLSVSISGTGSTAQKTVNGAAMSGAVAAAQPASPNEPPLRVKVIS